LILDCYRLAKFYGRHPDEFLSLPISAIRRHMNFTAQLLAELHPEEE
jgi:hypothetical protein